MPKEKLQEVNLAEVEGALPKAVVSEEVKNKVVTGVDGNKIVNMDIQVAGIKVATYDQVVTVASWLKPVLNVHSGEDAHLNYSDGELIHVSTWAISQGVNPLMHGVHWHTWKNPMWKKQNGNWSVSGHRVEKMLHYKIWRSMASSRWGNYLSVEKVKNDLVESDESSVLTAQVRIVPESIRADFQDHIKFVFRQLVDLDINVEEALDIAEKRAFRLFSYKGEANVEWSEVFEHKNNKVQRKKGSSNISGWAGPEHRAIVRATTNVIREKLGNPPFFDVVRICFGEIKPDQVMEAIEATPPSLSELPDEIADTHFKQVAATVVNNGPEDTLEERNNLIHRDPKDQVID